MSSQDNDPDRDDATGPPPGGPFRGSFAGAGGPVPPGRGPVRAGRGRLLPTVLILVAVLAVIGWGATLWTEFLWYESVGFRNVLTTRLLSQIGLFLLAGALTGLAVWSGLWLAWRHRPVYAPSTPEQAALDRYRSALDPMRRLVFVAVPLLLGAFTGTAAASQWQTVLLFVNREPFGVVDPHHGIDVGFFVFSLPFWQMVVSFATLVLGLTLVGALLTHYIYGGLQLQGGPGSSRTTTAARVHLATVLALLLLVRAGGYWIERYSLSMTEHARITGMQYTDVHAVLPTRGILAVAALLCALFFLSTIWTRTWRLPLISLAGLLVVALLLGGAYPALVQQLRVVPSEAQLEAPYIEDAIQSTLAAYDLEGIEKIDYNAETEAEPGQLRSDADTVPGIRIVDPSVVSPTFRQLQGVRNYYQFADALDVDRYEVDGERVDTVIAVRELNLAGISAGQRNWVNDHTVYTHGFGVVAAYGNRRSAEGEPVFYERNIPPVGGLGEYEPRIYFGEASPTYSIVGSPADVAPRELDYPASGQDSGAGEVRNTYDGVGGVAIGNLARRAAYAIKYRHLEILLSDSVNSESVMLDHRNPRERVERVAPWLRLDGNPYPAIVDGRVLWIIDGYTVSSRYPYSQLEELGEATADSLQQAENIRSIGQGKVNYIRNSVKATVDAYDGTVSLYTWDEEDPLLKAWSKVFDGSVLPMDEISGDLMSHFRYPEDLFKVQREVLSRYHVQDAGSFFTGQDFWTVSEDPSVEGEAKPDIPPYYLSIAMPGQDEPTFSLTTTYIPAGSERQNLTGYLAVDADAGSEAGERREDYGTMRMLVLPRETTVRGPGQFQNEVNSSNEGSEAFDVTLSQFLNLNRQQGSQVTIGNLLTLPVGGGLLYVEPVYVQSAGGSSYPLQRVVVAAFGNELGWSDTLDGALDELFGGDSGATAGDAGDEGPTTSPPTDGEDGGEDAGDPGAEPTGDLAEAIAEIQQAYEDGQAALEEGDWQAYGEAQERLQEAIRKAVEASPEGGSLTLPGGDAGADDATQTDAP
ncbi:UPF0182 family protein [Ornithinimicrobium humiphilum]|uniref:UPF0182 protein FB476_2399 n=1 Tax=Ornithinimicrobium humiphilum TaxID=125288 RepID=A0A543KQY0_9MICO|nr:UPF0182 family protein [Ornithinimicrobium humiphilum]TQM97486.1 hypothetical protein FB476_2399 [Ornithinimicrobium humiphilum]